MGFEPRPCEWDGPGMFKMIRNSFVGWTNDTVSNIAVLETIFMYAKVPVINAMTDINHPCEILTDLYSLSKIRPDFKIFHTFCTLLIITL